MEKDSFKHRQRSLGDGDYKQMCGEVLTSKEGSSQKQSRSEERSYLTHSYLSSLSQKSGSLVQVSKEISCVAFSILKEDHRHGI